MKHTRDREGKPAGAHARPPGSRKTPTRLGVIAATVATLLFAIPVGSAVADPKPSLKALSKQAEELHTEIETLSEQYNGQREKLKTAKKSVDAAQKTLATSESDLAAKRAKARCWPRTPTSTAASARPSSSPPPTTPRASSTGRPPPTRWSSSRAQRSTR